MSKQIYYVIKYDTDTRTFSIDSDVTDALLTCGAGDIYDTDVDEWMSIYEDDEETDFVLRKHISEAWKKLNVMIDDFKSGGENAY